MENGPGACWYDMAMMIHSKWNKEQCSLKEGHLILLEEWRCAPVTLALPLGRVVKTFPGDDGRGQDPWRNLDAAFREDVLVGRICLMVWRMQSSALPRTFVVRNSFRFRLSFVSLTHLGGGTIERSLAIQLIVMWCDVTVKTFLLRYEFFGHLLVHGLCSSTICICRCRSFVYHWDEETCLRFNLNNLIYSKSKERKRQ